MRHGHWILLDELNLASQSVLEGLNAVLDHRRSVFVPELGEEVGASANFRLFGAQNPAMEGGGRRRLPRSFLNRFTRLYFETLEDDDIEFIATAMCPWVQSTTVTRMVALFRDIRQRFSLEFNLRDTLRWCELLKAPTFRESDAAFDIIVLQRLPSGARQEATAAFEGAFGYLPHVEPEPQLRALPSKVRVGCVELPRGSYITSEGFGIGFKPFPQILNSQLRQLQALSAAVVRFHITNIQKMEESYDSAQGTLSLTTETCSSSRLFLCCDDTRHMDGQLVFPEERGRVKSRLSACSEQSVDGRFTR